MWAAVCACAVVVVVGLIVLWPGGGSEGSDPLGLAGDPVRALVGSVEEVPCSFDPLLACKRIGLVVSEGESNGERFELE